MKNTQKVTLNNGLTILLEHLPDAQSAGIGFFVRTGARDETRKESGVSHFLEHMMFKGTPKRSSADIQFDLGNLGAQANAFTSEENTVYYASVIPENFPAMQELLTDMLRPALDPQEYSTEKKVILEEIALYQDKPHFYLMEQSTLDFFAGHAAGNSVLGTSASIEALECSEMAAYFNRRYSPANTVLVAAGQFDPQRFIADAKKLTSHWVPHDAPRLIKPFAAQPMHKDYHRKNVTQAHVLLMTDGPSAQSAHRYPMALLSMILGDSSGSRLYWSLVDKGLVESTGAFSDERDGCGVFGAYASTEPERLEQVVKIVEDILATPLEFSEADLERARNKLISKVVIGGELPMGRLMAIGLEWNYRQATTSLDELLAEIRAITRDDIAQALKAHPLKTWGQFRLLPEV
jgi:predicted Zn-dependent peptidase